MAGRPARVYRLVLAVALAGGVSLTAPAAGHPSAGFAMAGVDRSPLVSVGRPHCQPGDLVETGLQGQVPWQDRLDGRAARGYRCNLSVVGEHRGYSFANFDTYRNCAYYSDNDGAIGTLADAGTVVLDVSDPRHPVQTAYLTARAMRDAGESLRVNARRGLLVADHYGLGHFDVDSYPWLGVYDVSHDCRHPVLLADVAMPHGRGHEGWFSPDGLVYYMSGVGSRTVTPVDLSDPAHPRELATWPMIVHGGSISEDGSRGYLAEIGAPSEVLIVDTSDVAPGRPAAGRVISRIPLPHNAFNQSTYRLDYAGHPYLIDFGESTTDFATRCTDPSATSFDSPRMIDLADELHPRVVATFVNEVDDPANCPLVANDRTFWHSKGFAKGDFAYVFASGLFMYDVHYCTPDRLHDPTILACATELSGLRVYDIRDPLRPREIAYDNTGTRGRYDPNVDVALARPVVRSDLGQIWWVTMFSGFHVARFENGVWPFPGTDPCPGAEDYLQAQYDLGYSACRAAHRGVTAPGSP